jgi:hypothetical protein
MSEPSTRELYDKLNELKVDLGIISTKVDFFNDVRRTAEDADSKADKALAIAEDNREDIRDMRANTKWLWGCGIAVVAAIIPIGIVVFS